MSSKKEEEKQQPKIPGRRSSLKSYNKNNKLDQNNLLNIKSKRHSVSWGQSNTFQFKAMKALFQESNDITKDKKDTEEHKQFIESRKKSIKNEFSLVKELMQQKQYIIDEDEESEESDEEVKNNTNKNIKIGKSEINEESSKSDSDTDKDNNK